MKAGTDKKLFLILNGNSVKVVDQDQVCAHASGEYKHLYLNLNTALPELQDVSEGKSQIAKNTVNKYLDF